MRNSKAELNNPVEGKRVRFVEDAGYPQNADGVCGYLEAVGDSTSKRSFYDRVFKRLIDVIMSFCGLIILSPAFLIITVAVLIDDPGPIFFKQKRVGLNKRFFYLHKFRTMKMSTPHDTPTHMLVDPGRYITRVGAFLRKHSLDELPQFWDIFVSNMSIIGPRPALYNQDLLTAERDRYNANDIKPGLTGWAQINGRDELSIPDKARLDGVYTKKLNAGGFAAFLFDCRCFFGTAFSVARAEGVVEGGTGAAAGEEPHDPNNKENHK
ncbi:MAG: sugar transferase [Lachnospiraceae bacterium]|nr:sugar transferase [Lachnospiraceae bacterium]